MNRGSVPSFPTHGRPATSIVEGSIRSKSGPAGSTTKEIPLQPIEGKPGQFAGSVYLYERNAGSWVFKQKFTGSGVYGGAQFGSAVALEGDRLAVGCPVGVQPVGWGTAYVFERQSGMSPGEADGCVRFTWDLGSPYPLPEHIRLVGEAMASPAA